MYDWGPVPFEQQGKTSDVALADAQHQLGVALQRCNRFHIFPNPRVRRRLRRTHEVAPHASLDAKFLPWVYTLSAVPCPLLLAGPWPLSAFSYRPLSSVLFFLLAP